MMKVSFFWIDIIYIIFLLLFYFVFPVIDKKVNQRIAQIVFGLFVAVGIILTIFHVRVMSTSVQWPKAFGAFEFSQFMFFSPIAFFVPKLAMYFQNKEKNRKTS